MNRLYWNFRFYSESESSEKIIITEDNKEIFSFIKNNQSNIIIFNEVIKKLDEYSSEKENGTRVIRAMIAYIDFLQKGEISSLESVLSLIQIL